MNKYIFEATCLCPNGKLKDRYECELSSRSTIQVELIGKYIAKLAKRRMYQEQIADELRNEFMAGVRVVGWHYGIKVECVRE